jgi:hypothetical protein
MQSLSETLFSKSWENVDRISNNERSKHTHLDVEHGASSSCAGDFRAGNTVVAE